MEKMMLGVELLIIGMGTVIISLYLLSVYLYFSGKLLGPEAGGKNNKSQLKNITAETSEKKQRKIKKKVEIINSNEKKIAAITAAVYKMMADKNDFRIISISKRGNNWQDRERYH